MPALRAVVFFEVVLALHILAVVFAFGATFAYPVFVSAIGKADPRAVPALYRAFHAVSRMVIMPGLVVVVICGIYLASKLHVWNSFFVQWGLGVAIVIGAVEGMFLSPNEKRLCEVSERDLAAAGDGVPVPSAEQNALVRRVSVAGVLMDVLVVLTIYFMVVHQ